MWRKCRGMCLRQKTSKSQGRRRNIFILYFPTQSYICQIEELHLAMHEFCHAGRMLQVFRCTYNYRGFGLLSDLTIRLQKKSVLKQKGGAGDAEPQSFTLFRPLLLLLLLILDHLCCPDPDHNLGGWCYRKPKTPGEIVLLHGDSPLFTSSLTGCLKEEREEERQKEGERWGDYGEKKRR